MRIVFPLAAAASFISSNSLLAAPAVPPSDAGALASAVPDDAIQLARLIYPQNKVLELELKAYDAGTVIKLRGDSQSAALLAKYPGIIDAIVTAGHAVIEKHLVARAPERQQQFAAFYAEHFSPAEIDQLITFYSSPTGDKLIERLYTRTDVQQLIATVPGNLDNGLTVEQADNVRHRASAQAYEQFNADDKKALAAFVATPVYAKLGQLRGDFHALLARAEEDPTLYADLDAAVEATVKDYMVKHRRH